MIDAIDRQIIQLLQTNGRMKKSDLAQEVGLSIPAVAERVRKLQENGVILGFTAIVDPRTLGMDVGAIITLISESSKNYDEVIRRAEAHPEVLECMSVTGDGSHRLVIRTENTSTLEQLLTQIQSWPGVNRTETKIILSHYKHHGPIQVAESVMKKSH